MPTKTYWIDEPTIMSADYEGKVTSDDLDSVMTNCLGACESRKVHFVVDMSSNPSMPANILKLASLSTLVNHPNAGWFAFVQPNMIVKFAMQVKHRGSFKIFDTRDEAVAFLRERVQDDETAKEKDHAN
jgi:hypothetical protein